MGTFGVVTPIWTNQQIEQWREDAYGQIAVDVNCIWARECIAVQQGNSVYTLPKYVRSLRRITWRGRSLEPQSWEELTLLTPATTVLHQPPDTSGNTEYSQSRPLFYAPHPTDAYNFRFYPCPNESFTTSGEPNPYAPTPNSPSCIIEYWREPDSTNQSPTISLPPYIARRTMKAYVLWKAFAAEGKGQDMQASDFYQQKYRFLIDKFRHINEGCFVSKKYALGDGGMLDPQNFKYPRPMLNPNFERTIF